MPSNDGGRDKREEAGRLIEFYSGPRDVTMKDGPWKVLLTALTRSLRGCLQRLSPARGY